MFGLETITDEMVQAATQDSAADRERIMEAMASQVRAMITVRLSPTPAQFHAVEDLTQQSLMALSEGLARLGHPTVGVLMSYTSVIVARRVADFLRCSGPAKGEALASLDSPASLDSSVHDVSDSEPLWQMLSASGLSPRSSLVRAEAVRQVISEVGLLKPAHREVITLAFFDQLQMGEIAERMSVSRPAASMLLIRAVKDLRRTITGFSKVENIRDNEK